MRRGAFTLVELLVSIAVMALLMGVLLPAVGSARETARTARCLSNVRQLGIGWVLYADDHDGWAMPLAYTEAPDVGFLSDGVFWFGTDGRVTGRVDYAAGLLSPFVGTAADGGGVYECAAQPEGSYRPQGGAGERTTTYGYNGYGLCPPKTPGWGGAWGPIGGQRWRRVDGLARPSEVLVFADTLLWTGPRGEARWSGEAARSTALLDPPMLFSNGSWSVNESPTTAFRHPEEAAVGVRADGSAAAHAAEADWLVVTEGVEGASVGSVGTEPGPWHVPDWERWK